MKKFRIISALFCLIATYQNSKAQNQQNDGNGTTVIVWPHHPLLFLGGGINSPGTALKNEAHFKNFAAINLNAYIPLISKDKSSFGVNTGFEYSFDSSNNFRLLPNPYQVTGQSSSPVITAKGTGSPKAQGFKFEAGPSAMIKLSDNNFGINSSINLAYLSINHKSFMATQTSEVNGTAYNWDLLKQEETKTSGLGIVPKLRLLYMFGKVGVWMEGSYIIGPKIKTLSTVYHPEGNIHQDGTYSLGQMNFPSYTTSENNVKYRAFGISGGIVIELGGGENPTDRRLKGKVIRMGDKGIVRRDHPLYVKNPEDGGTTLNPNTGSVPQLMYTRVFCENGKKVMKYFNTQGSIENITPIYSNIPCDQNTFPITGVIGDLHVNSDTGPLTPMKNWDGTIKHLFEVPEDYMIVPNIDRFVEKMNKSTHYKTTIIADGNQKYIKIVNWNGKEGQTQFTPIIETSPAGIILGYHYSCKSSCPNGCDMKNGHCAPCDFAGATCYEVKEGSYHFHKEFPVIKVNPFLVDNNNNTGNTKYNELVRSLFSIDYKIKNIETITEGEDKFLILLISNESKQMILINKILNGSTTND